METTEIILRDNGTLAQRVINERDLDADATVLEVLTEDVVRNLRNLVKLPEWGMVHASVGRTDTIWSVPLDRIPLNALFRLSDGILVPSFTAPTDIEMPLIWRAPSDVRLVFVLRTETEGMSLRVSGNWLFAYDGEQRGYRLPLPNLHDDCLICTGSFDERHATGAECVTASLEQFRKSKWNADLMRTVERSQQFFRFQPTEDTIETLHIAVADWTSLCDKVSTDLMERVLV